MLADWLANPLTDIERIDERLDAVAELVAEPRAGRRACRPTARHLRPRAAAGARDHRPGQPARSVRSSAARWPACRRSRPRSRPAAAALLAELEERARSVLRGARRAGAGPGRRLPARQPRGRLHSRRLFGRARRAARADQRRQAVDRPLPGRRIGATRASPTSRSASTRCSATTSKSRNAHSDKIPAHYIRKQTVKNAERYITPELKEHEERVLSADEKSRELEYDLFCRAARDGGRQRGAAAAHGRRAGRARRAGRRWPTWPASAAIAGRRSSPSRCWRSSTAGIRCSTRWSAQGSFVPNDAQLRRRGRLFAAGHRAEHGRQEHVHPPGGADHADGASRQLRAGPRRPRSAWPIASSPAWAPATSWRAAKARSWSR